MDQPNPLRELFKEFALINRKSVFADQARIEFPKGEDHPFDLEVLLTPTSGPFRDACVKFSIKLPANYPRAAPTVKCLNRIFHPNVSTTGNVCFSMFSGDWNASYRLEHFINGLLWFLQNPNPDSALNSLCSIKDPKEFEKMVRLAMSGLPAKGKIYDRIIVMDSSLPENILAQFFFEMSARGLTLRAALDAHTGALPELSWLKMVKGTAFDGEVIKLTGVCSSTVTVRAKRLKVPEAHVMKELVLRVGDNFVLALVRGPKRVSFAQVAALMGVKEDQCALATVLDVATKLKLNHRAVPAFGHAALFSATLVDSLVAAEPALAFYTATGVPNLILKTTFAHIEPFLVGARVAEFATVAPLVVPTKVKAPAVVAVPAAAAVVAPAPAPAVAAPAVTTLPVTVVAAPAPAAAAPAPTPATQVAVPAVTNLPALPRAALDATPSPSPAPAAALAVQLASITREHAELTAQLEVQRQRLLSLTFTARTVAAPADPLRQQQRSALQVST